MRKAKCKRCWDSKGGGVENYNGENMRDRNKQVRDKINNFEIFPLEK